MSTISIIVAIADNNAIGRDNQLLWHLPADMRRFKALTMGHTVIMGRKTFESLPKGALPGRRNVVLTTRPGAHFEGCTTYASLEEAFSGSASDDEVFIIGGAKVYSQSLQFADKIYLTLVHTTPKDADAFFPTIDPSHWEEIEHQEFPSDDRHAYPYTFLTYRRK